MIKNENCLYPLTDAGYKSLYPVEDTSGRCQWQKESSGPTQCSWHISLPGGRCRSIFAGVVTWPPIRRPWSPPVVAAEAAAAAAVAAAEAAAAAVEDEEEEEEPCCVAGSRMIGPEVMMTSGSPLPGGVAVPAADDDDDDNIDTVESALRFKGRLWW